MAIAIWLETVVVLIRELDGRVRTSLRSTHQRNGTSLSYTADHDQGELPPGGNTSCLNQDKSVTFGIRIGGAIRD